MSEQKKKPVIVRFNLGDGQVAEKWYASAEEWDKEKADIEKSAGQKFPEPSKKEHIQTPNKEDMQ
jgi:hypothetical protein